MYALDNPTTFWKVHGGLYTVDKVVYLL